MGGGGVRQSFFGFIKVVQHTFGYTVWCIIGTIFLGFLKRKFDKTVARLSFSPNNSGHWPIML